MTLIVGLLVNLLVAASVSSWPLVTAVTVAALSLIFILSRFAPLFAMRFSFGYAAGAVLAGVYLAFQSQYSLVAVFCAAAIAAWVLNGRASRSFWGPGRPSAFAMARAARDQKAVMELRAIQDRINRDTRNGEPDQGGN